MCIVQKIIEGTYAATVTFVKENGYGESDYRVMVTFNSGEDVSFLKSYKTINAALKAARREIDKFNN